MISDGVKHGKLPIQILKNVNSLDPENHINIKVVQNEKYRYEKEQKPKFASQNNTADDFQILINQLQSLNFIKAIHANTDQKNPNVICFSDEQLLEMRECATHGSLIGIDRTFNLGACYVTTMVYTNSNLLRRGKTTPPVMLGPVFLHWDGAYSTYCDFLAKIRSSL